MVILLVEDEPIIALHLQQVLAQGGHQVLHATEISDALMLTHHHHPQMALLNFKQADSGNGVQLARALRSMSAIKILFLTGSRSQDLQNGHVSDLNFGVIHKPFTLCQFKEAVRL